MRLILLALSALVLCGSGLPPRGGAAFTAGSSVTLSPSASTIYMTWTTGAAGSSLAYCGTTQGGPYNNPGVDNGVQTSVTSHNIIVAGLAASTTYYCRATSLDGSGNATYNDGSVATLAAPATTQITDVSMGTPVNNDTLVPNANKITGDTFNNVIASDGTTYVGTDDTPGGWGNASPSANLMLGKFTSESPNLLGVTVNSMTSFGGESNCNGNDTLSPKETGLYAYQNLLFMWLGRQNEAACGGPSIPPFPQYEGTVNKSADYGATWANFQNPTTFNANGSMTNPTNVSMFGNAGDFAGTAPVMYGADNGTNLCPGGTRIDGCDAYVYMLSDRQSTLNSSSPSNNGGSILLARWPLYSMVKLDKTTIQYYTGGDGNLDSNWSPSIASATQIITECVGFIATQFIFKINRYFAMSWCYPNASDTSTSNLLLYEGAHPWSLAKFKTISNTPHGFYSPTVLQRSALSGSNLTVLYSGDFNNQGPNYHMWVGSMQLICGGGNC